MTGEYVVLKGAKALAIPTKYGQSMEVESHPDPGIQWRSLDNKDQVWFEARITTADLSATTAIEDPVKARLVRVLKAAKELNPMFLNDPSGYKVTTSLNFNREWGLGTSSTLISNVAKWARVDAFQLLETGFGGSGYDIAAAQRENPIIYKRREGNPLVEEVTLNWDFTDKLYFVFLNRKQSSKSGIKHFQQVFEEGSFSSEVFTRFTDDFINCSSLEEFETLIHRHEKAISEIIQLEPVQEKFRDYPGAIKSLGAWGGDFVLVTGSASDLDYFRRKDYHTIIPFSEMLK